MELPGKAIRRRFLRGHVSLLSRPSGAGEIALKGVCYLNGYNEKLNDLLFTRRLSEILLAPNVSSHSFPTLRLFHLSFTFCFHRARSDSRLVWVYISPRAPQCRLLLLRRRCRSVRRPSDGFDCLPSRCRRRRRRRRSPRSGSCLSLSLLPLLSVPVVGLD